MYDENETYKDKLVSILEEYARQLPGDDNYDANDEYNDNSAIAGRFQSTSSSSSSSSSRQQGDITPPQRKYLHRIVTDLSQKQPWLGRSVTLRRTSAVRGEPKKEIPSPPQDIIIPSPPQDNTIYPSPPQSPVKSLFSTFSTLYPSSPTPSHPSAPYSPVSQELVENAEKAQRLIDEAQRVKEEAQRVKEEALRKLRERQQEKQREQEEIQRQQMENQVVEPDQSNTGEKRKRFPGGNRKTQRNIRSKITHKRRIRVNNKRTNKINISR
jgi:hypothetical protein